MQDEIYLENIQRIYKVSKDRRDISIRRDIKNLVDVYYPISLSPSVNSLNELLESYNEAQQTQGSMIRVLPTMLENEQNELVQTRDKSPFFSSKPIRKMIFSSPGCGKTLFTQRLALSLANNNAAMFPLMLHCSILHKNAADNLDDFIQLADKMKAVAKGIEFEKNDFSEMINRHADNDLLIIIDGMDECSSDERKLISAKLIEFLGNHKNTGFVMTARLGNYKSEELVSTDGVKYHFIEKLTDSAMFSYIYKWFSVYKYADQNTEAIRDKIENIIDTFNNKCDKDIRYLVRIPMYLSNVLKVSGGNQSDIPHNTNEYYDKFIALIKRGLSLEESDFYDPFLCYIAYWMSCCPKKRYVSIDEDTLKNEIIFPYPQRNQRNVDEIMQTLVDRISVLTQIDYHDGNEYRFEHLSLQELLTAKALMSYGDNTTDFDGYIRKDCNPVDFIRRVTYDDGWKEYDQIIRFILQLSDLDEEEREEIEYLLKKKGIYDSVNNLI